MGTYFLMSRRFNKRQPEDFGWGKETGFYRIPLLDFQGLVNLILQSKSEEDKYGAASVILDDYCDELAALKYSKTRKISRVTSNFPKYLSSIFQRTEVLQRESTTPK